MLTNVLPLIIMPTQSAFLKRRLMTDSFMTASQIVSWCYKSNLDCVCVKAYFEKAFDNVWWAFLKGNNALGWF